MLRVVHIYHNAYLMVPEANENNPITFNLPGNIKIGTLKRRISKINPIFDWSRMRLEYIQPNVIPANNPFVTLMNSDTLQSYITQYNIVGPVNLIMEYPIAVPTYSIKFLPDPSLVFDLINHMTTLPSVQQRTRLELMGINPQNLITADQVNSKLMELCRIQTGQEYTFEIWPLMPGGPSYLLEPQSANSYRVKPGGEKVTIVDDYQTSTFKDYVFDNQQKNAEDATQARFISAAGGNTTRLFSGGDRIKGTFVQFLRFNKSENPNPESDFRHLYSGIMMLRGPFTRYNYNNHQTQTFGDATMAVNINIGGLVRNLNNSFEQAIVDKGNGDEYGEEYGQSDESDEDSDESDDDVPPVAAQPAAPWDENQGMGGHKHSKKHKSKKYKLYKSIRKSLDKIIKLLKHKK